MNLVFQKVSEDELIVSYWITTTHWNKNIIGEVTREEVAAFCTFNKVTEKVSYDPDKTDAYYYYRTDEPMYIALHLKKIHKKKQLFPEFYNIVTGCG